MAIADQRPDALEINSSESWERIPQTPFFKWKYNSGE